jgi:hypothetical protein
MSDKPAVGGNNYRAVLKALREERVKLLRLVEQIAQPGITNGNLYRLKAEILSSLIKIDDYLDTLDEVGQAARQERRTS